MRHALPRSTMVRLLFGLEVEYRPTVKDYEESEKEGKKKDKKGKGRDEDSACD